MSKNDRSRRTFTGKKGKVFLALTEGKSQKDAAALADVSDRTVRRWLSDDEALAAALHEAISDQVRDSSRRRTLLADKAIDQLEKILDDAQISPSLKLRAIGIILTSQDDLAQSLDFDHRLSRLEGMAQ